MEDEADADLAKVHVGRQARRGCAVGFGAVGVKRRQPPHHKVVQQHVRALAPWRPLRRQR